MQFKFKKNVNFRKILFWGVIVSLFFNVSVLLIYFSVIDIFSPRALSLTGFFLLVFLLVLQPIRDELLSFVAEKIIFAQKLKTSQLEEKAAALNSLEDAFRFLQELVALWEISGIRLVIYLGEGQIYFFRKRGKKVRSIEFRKKENEEFLIYLQNYPQAQNVRFLPQVIRTYLLKRKIRAIAPIYFREEILGFLGFMGFLSEENLEVAEIVAQRIGILLKNENLKTFKGRSATLKREFYLAERIENYLLSRKIPNHLSYELIRPIEEWNKKYFAALFEFVSCELKTDREPLYFVLLVKLSTSSLRMHALQLFAVQGYFISLGSSSPSIELLAEQLQLSLSFLENSKIELEGFLISLDEKELSLLYFGSNLSYKCDGVFHVLPESPNLGTKDFQINHLNLSFAKELELSLRGYPLLILKKSRV